MDKQSLSFSHGKPAPGHTRRDFTPHSADVSLASRNVELVHTDDYRQAIEDMIAPSVARYNARQKRQDRRRDPHDVVADLFSKKSQKVPVYSLTIQIGNHETLGVCDAEFDRDEWEALKKTDQAAASAYVRSHLADNDPKAKDAHARQLAAYADIVREFQRKYPQMVILEAMVHEDEPAGTPHLQLEYTWLAGGEGSTTFKRGFDTQVSMTKALGELGFKTKTVDDRRVTAQTQWQADAKEAIAQVMLEHGFERDVKGDGRDHEETNAYVARQRRLDNERKADEAEARLVAADDAHRALEQSSAELAEKVASAEKDFARQQASLMSSRAAVRKADADVARAKKELKEVEKRRDDAARKAERAEADARAKAALSKSLDADLESATSAIEDAKRKREEMIDNLASEQKRLRKMIDDEYADDHAEFERRRRKAVENLEVAMDGSPFRLTTVVACVLLAAKQVISELIDEDTADKVYDTLLAHSQRLLDYTAGMIDGRLGPHTNPWPNIRRARHQEYQGKDAQQKAYGRPLAPEPTRQRQHGPSGPSLG